MQKAGANTPGASTGALLSLEEESVFDKFQTAWSQSAVCVP